MKLKRSFESFFLFQLSTHLCCVAFESSTRCLMSLCSTQPICMLSDEQASTSTLLGYPLSGATATWERVRERKNSDSEFNCCHHSTHCVCSRMKWNQRRERVRTRRKQVACQIAQQHTWNSFAYIGSFILSGISCRCCCSLAPSPPPTVYNT